MRGCPEPDLVLALVSGELDPAPRGELRTHIDECDACRELVAFAVRLQTGGVPAPEATHDLHCVGRYRLVRLIDAGGMGVVYEAEDPQLGRRVAVKMLHRSPEGSERSDEDPGVSLLREARAVATLEHPAVIDIYDVGQIDGRAFFVMELVGGGTLAQWIAAGPRPFAEVVRAFAPLASGLAAMHGLGIVHRDFKPSNVLIRDDGSFVITDFGLAEISANRTETGSTMPESSDTSPGLLGTPAYMAPEQANGRPATAASDQYGFALCVIEALAGGDRPSDLSALSLPKRSRQALKRAMSPDPDDRFDSVRSLWSAFAPAPRRARWAVAAGVASVAVALGVFALRADPVPTPVVQDTTVIPATPNPEFDRRIDAVEELAISAKRDEAREQIDAIIEDASGPPPDPALPRALRWRAKVRAQQDEIEAARQDMERAHHLAREMSNDIELVRTATGLAFLYSRQPKEAQKWFATAEASLARTEVPAIVRAELADVRADFAYTQGDYEAAIGHARAGLELLEGGEDSVIQSNLLSTLAWAHADRVEWDEARAAAEEAAALVLRLRGPEDVAYLELRRLEALIADSQGREDDAMRHLMYVRSAAISNPDVPPSIRMRARVAVSRALRRRDRLEDAIEELEQALEEANHSPLDAGQLIPAYSSLAWAHIDAEHYDRALTYLERALVLAEEEGPGPNTALILAAKGRALDGLDRAEAATEAFDEAIGMLDAALGETNPKSLWVRELRAAARVRIEPEISRRELERVVAAFETQLGEDEPLLIDAYRDLADAELHCDDRTAARKHLERSLEVMRGVHPEGHPELVARQKQIDALKRGGA